MKITGIQSSRELTLGCSGCTFGVQRRNIHDKYCAWTLALLAPASLTTKEMVHLGKDLILPHCAGS